MERDEKIRELELAIFDLQALAIDPMDSAKASAHSRKLTMLGRQLQALRAVKPEMPTLARTQVKEQQ